MIRETPVEFYARWRKRVEEKRRIAQERKEEKARAKAWREEQKELLAIRREQENGKNVHALKFKTLAYQRARLVMYRKSGIHKDPYLAGVLAGFFGVADEVSRVTKKFGGNGDEGKSFRVGVEQAGQTHLEDILGELQGSWALNAILFEAVVRKKYSKAEADRICEAVMNRQPSTHVSLEKLKQMLTKDVRREVAEPVAKCGGFYEG